MITTSLFVMLLIWNAFITAGLLYLVNKPPIVNTGEVINNHPITEKTINTQQYMVVKDDMELVVKYMMENEQAITAPIKEALKYDFYFMQELSMNLNNLQVHR